jgi:hypothetical protein
MLRIARNSDNDVVNTSTNHTIGHLKGHEPIDYDAPCMPSQTFEREF